MSAAGYQSSLRSKFTFDSHYSYVVMCACADCLYYILGNKLLDTLLFKGPFVHSCVGQQICKYLFLFLLRASKCLLKPLTSCTSRATQKKITSPNLYVLEAALRKADNGYDLPAMPKQKKHALSWARPAPGHLGRGPVRAQSTSGPRGPFGPRACLRPGTVSAYVVGPVWAKGPFEPRTC